MSLATTPLAPEARTVSPQRTARHLTGHRGAPLGPSPFAATRPGVITAIGFGLASLIWLAAGELLPGGRWLVVHLFTLGVLTPLIWTFSQHFAARFTGTADLLPRRGVTRSLACLLTVAIVVMLTGRALGIHVLLAIGSLGIMAIVGSNLLVLRRLRRAATTSRFTWVVRRYEHAHLAFLVAAGLGGALGAGWIPGVMFGSVREAHIHLTVLGWAGLTVLATLVAFGPALLRVRMEPGADTRAAAALQVATFGLAVAAGGFIVTGLGDGVGAGPAALMTVGGLAAYGYGVVVVAGPLLRASRRSDRSPLRWAVMGALVWFLVAIAIDIVLVATGTPSWSHGMSAALLIGMLAQLVLAVLLYVGPMLRGRDLAARDRLLARVERFARSRTGTLNLGVLLLVGGQVLGRLTDLTTQPVTRAGWILVSAAVVAHLVVLLWPLGDSDPDRVRSSTVSRYRTAA